MSTLEIAGALLLLGVVAFGLSIGVRRLFPELRDLDTGPWSSTLSYVASAFSVVVGFTIVFLFTQFSSAKDAVGAEASAIGTAFEDAWLISGQTEDIQHALICFSRSLPEYEWPALRRNEAAPEADQAYRNVFLVLEDSTGKGEFESAASKSIIGQLETASSARASWQVTAETQIGDLLWIFLIGGGFLVVMMIFVVSLPKRPVTQAGLVAASTVFTVVMLLLIALLSTPFREGAGRVTPELIENTTTVMEAASPDAASRPCDLASE